MRLSRNSPTPSFSLPRHRFALLTAFSTLALVGVGGLVTSHGVGMAVPDWPNTYGYNMFFFPVSKWVGGIFYEHSHRLVASAVGLMTTILAVWLFGRPARGFLRWIGAALILLGIVSIVGARARWADGVVAMVAGAAAFGSSVFWPRCEAAPKWLRRLGVIAFFAVVVQGVLGGLRVVLFKDQIGIFHAALAQLFFVLTCALAWFTRPAARSSNAELSPDASDPSAAASPSPPLEERAGERRPLLFVAGKTQETRPAPARLAVFLFLATLLIFIQLILGATMRHQHAGLSIPDFPLAYGKLWPATDAQSVAHYNQARLEVLAANPITAFQIVLQMVHRLMALLILAAVATCAWLANRRLGSKHPLSRFTLVWLGLILVQVLLGAATIWSDKAADIATAHVLVGALSLSLGSLLSIVHFQMLRSQRTAPESRAQAPAASILGTAAPLPGHA